jgi:hypothetical protein
MKDSENRLTEGDLSQFTGTSQDYAHPLGVVYTNGVQYMAEHGGGHWLIDLIAAGQFDSRILNNPMLQQIQFWTLTVKDDRSALLGCERDSDDVAISQEIPFTDFPLKTLKLYYQAGVILLPSEY